MSTYVAVVVALHLRDVFCGPPECGACALRSWMMTFRIVFPRHRQDKLDQSEHSACASGCERRLLRDAHTHTYTDKMRTKCTVLQRCCVGVVDIYRHFAHHAPGITISIFHPIPTNGSCCRCRFVLRPRHALSVRRVQRTTTFHVCRGIAAIIVRCLCVCVSGTKRTAFCLFVVRMCVYVCLLFPVIVRNMPPNVRRALRRPEQASSIFIAFMFYICEWYLFVCSSAT